MMTDPHRPMVFPRGLVDFPLEACQEDSESCWAGVVADTFPANRTRRAWSGGLVVKSLAPNDRMVGETVAQLRDASHRPEETPSWTCSSLPESCRIIIGSFSYGVHLFNGLLHGIQDLLSWSFVILIRREPLTRPISATPLPLDPPDVTGAMSCGPVDMI